MPARKLAESELDPERNPQVIPFALQVVFACLPLLAMVIIVPSSSAYADAIDLHNGQAKDTAFAGFTVSALPLAVGIMLFPLAWMFEWCQSYRFMVWFGIFVSMAGHLMYGFSGLVMNKWYLLAARLVQGAGCYQALGKVYVSEMAAPKHRMYLFMWYISCVVSCYVLGNFLAYIVAVVSRDWTGDVFNRYTCSAWLMFILWVAYAVLFVLFWQEPTLEQRGWRVKEAEESQTLLAACTPSAAEEGQEAQVIATPASGATSSSHRAIAFLLATAFITTTISASWEMFTADWLYTEFNWGSHQTSLYLMGVLMINLFID